MTVVNGDLWQTQVEFRRDVESASVVRQYEVTDVIASDENTFGEGIVSGIIGRWETNWLPRMGPNSSIICCTARRVLPGAPTRTFVTFSSAGSGSGMADSEGSQNAMLVSLYPDSGGLPKSGRNYLPFLSGDDMTGGQIKTASFSALQAVVDAIFLTDIVMTSVGEIASAIGRPDPTAWLKSLITSLVLRPVIASQRRRVVHHQTTV